MDQEEYLQILFGDLGFTWKARNEWLKGRLGRPIRGLDELNSKEKSEIIAELKERKEPYEARDDRGDFEEHEERWTRGKK